MKESSIIQELDSYKNFLEDIKNDRLFHSIMLINSDDDFLMSYAKCLAGAILKNTEKVEKQVHPDLFVYGEGKAVDTATVNELLETVYIAPYEGDRKVYIIASFDDIGIVPANKLLKTLEEPPTGVTFILLVKNTSRVLQTILSRTQKFYLEGFGQKNVAELLKSKGISNGELISLETDGNLSKSILLARSQKYEDMFKFIVRTYKNYKVTADFSKTLLEAEEYKDNAKEMLNLFAVIAELTIRKRAKMEVVAPENIQIAVDGLSETWTNRALVMIIDAVIDAQKKLEANVGVSNCFDQFFLKILEVRRKCRV